jgi:hypothetical protein
VNYYKLISGNTFVGIATQSDFRVFQHKHQIMLVCDEEQAQYVQCGDVLYRSHWMVPVTTDRVSYETVEVIRIEKDEYDILYEAVEKGEDIKVEQEQPTPEVETPPVDPNEAATIDYVKTAKIAEMNHLCNKVIESGVDVLLSDGKVYHFSLTTQDQLNLITLQSMIAAGETSIPYHADGELCRYYSIEDIKKVMDTATAYTTFHVTYFNSLKVFINALGDIAAVSAVQYGMDIPIEYQSDILQALYAAMGGEQ